jgi:hypothetical protein
MAAVTPKPDLETLLAEQARVDEHLSDLLTDRLTGHLMSYCQGCEEYAISGSHDRSCAIRTLRRI